MTEPAREPAPERCAQCDAATGGAHLDLPFGGRIPLCEAHFSDALKLGGAVTKFLGDAGVRPDHLRRIVKGARGLAMVVDAARDAGGQKRRKSAKA